MSPNLEPMEGGRHEPDGTEENEDLTIPGGLLPTPIIVSSSDEELDISNTENTPQGYHPLPQDCEPDEEDQDNGVEYNSLSDLMNALSTHGPNTVSGDEEDETIASGTQEEEQSRTKESIPSHADTAAQEWEAEVRRETASVWRSEPPPPDRLQLDGGKVEQIKSVMASFTLPDSAIPPWAQNLTDDEWKSQISNLLGRRDY